MPTAEWVHLTDLTTATNTRPITSRAMRHREGSNRIDLPTDQPPALHTGLSCTLSGTCQTVPHGDRRGLSHVYTCEHVSKSHMQIHVCHVVRAVHILGELDF